MASWFGDDAEYEVTATVQGWLGHRTVRKSVKGRRAAEREASRLRRRGGTDVRTSRGGWWAAR